MGSLGGKAWGVHAGMDGRKARERGSPHAEKKRARSPPFRKCIASSSSHPPCCGGPAARRLPQGGWWRAPPPPPCLHLITWRPGRGARRAAARPKKNRPRRRPPSAACLSQTGARSRVVSSKPSLSFPSSPPTNSPGAFRTLPFFRPRGLVQSLWHAQEASAPGMGTHVNARGPRINIFDASQPARISAFVPPPPCGGSRPCTGFCLPKLACQNS